MPGGRTHTGATARSPAASSVDGSTKLAFPDNMLLALARIPPLNRGALRRRWIRYFEARVAGPVRTDFRGVPFLFHLDNPTERRALFNHYNLAELAFLRRHGGRPGAVFVDVGANAGFFTQNFLAAAAPGARVLAIEPNPAMVARLEANAVLLAEETAARDVRLFVETCACGAEDGAGLLDLRDGVGAAHLIAGDDPGDRSIRTRVRPLASLLEAHAIAAVDVLKIDVEGYEDRALVPFFNDAAPALHPRALIIEHTGDDRWDEDLWAVLAANGYRAARRTRGNLLMLRRPPG